MEERLTSFVIDASSATAMAAAAGVASVQDLLPLLVPSAQRLARPPISNYHVGAVGLGASGRIYIGVNLEFPSLPLHHSVHAEQFLVANAVLNGESAILSFAVSSAPCGHCRQFLQELRHAGDIKILVIGSDKYLPLSYFLPHPFGPLDLLSADLPLLLEPQNNHIGAIVDNDVNNDMKALVTVAEKAARGSHAHYSGCAAGFAVAGEGRVSGGGYMESAAYNPSLGPVQAAMVAWVVEGGGGWEGIEEAVLVEGEGAKVGWEGTARVLLAAVAPAARLTVYRYRMAI